MVCCLWLYSLPALIIFLTKLLRVPCGPGVVKNPNHQVLPPRRLDESQHVIEPRGIALRKYGRKIIQIIIRESYTSWVHLSQNPSWVVAMNNDVMLTNSNLCYKPQYCKLLGSSLGQIPNARWVYPLATIAK